MKYEVVVENIGTVYSGNNPVEARTNYGVYKRQSESGVGRAGNEAVVLFCDGEIELEHIPEPIINCYRALQRLGIKVGLAKLTDEQAS